MYPTAINAEVDRFARAIEFAAFRLLTDMGTKDNKEVSLDNETVGRMWKNSVGRNPGTAIFMAWRSYEVAIAVARLCFDGSMPKTKAVKQVAEDHRTNTTTVWNALKEHPDVFDLGALELGPSSYPSDSKEVGSLK